MANIASDAEVASFLNGKAPEMAMPEALAPQVDMNGVGVAPEAEALQYLDREIKQEKYGSGVEQLKAGLEGAASAATFGLSTGIQTGLGISTPEDIQGRREVNPGTYAAGQVAGLVGSALAAPLGGAAAAIDAAGVAGAKAATRALGLGGETAVAKIGSAAMKGIVENALFQSGDEVSKMLAKDPNQTAETALANIGISGLIGGGVGGGIGAVNPLWKATKESQLGNFLSSFVNKAGGIDGQALDAVQETLKKYGIDAPPEIVGVLTKDPKLQSIAKTLEQSDVTKSGIEFQKTLGEFKSAVSEKITERLGKTADDIANYSENVQGADAMRTLKDEYKQVYEPISKEYDNIADKFKGVELNKSQVIETPRDATNPFKIIEGTTDRIAGDADIIADRVAQMAKETGYDSANSAQSKIVNTVLEKLPNARTVDELSQLTSQIGNLTIEPALWNVGSRLKTIISDAQEEIIEREIGIKAPELIDKWQAAKSAYRDYKQMSQELSQYLGLGKDKGFKSFLSKLEQNRSPEEFLRRLSPKNQADVIPFLEKRFPGTLEKIRQNEMMQALKPAFRAAKEGEAINPARLRSAVEKMTPEQRAFVFGEEKLADIEGLSGLLDAFNQVPHNFSNSARTMDRLFEHVPGAAAGLGSLIAGHNPLLAPVMFYGAKAIGKDIPDMVRLGLLKMSASSAPVDAMGFKAMVDMIQHTMRGESLLTQGAKGVVLGTGSAFAQIKEPTDRTRKNLDEQLKKLQADPTPLLEVGGKTAHYMSGEGQALGRVAATAVNYLNGLRPGDKQGMPLDKKTEPSKAETAKYNRALNLAEQPLLVMKDIRDGTITPDDVMTIKTIYPALYQRMVDKFSSEIVTAQSKDVLIPYKARMGMSLFMGQPLDSTLTPEAIQAAQPKPPEPQPNVSKPATVSGGKAMIKTSELYQTPSQRNESKNRRS